MAFVTPGSEYVIAEEFIVGRGSSGLRQRRIGAASQELVFKNLAPGAAAIATARVKHNPRYQQAWHLPATGHRPAGKVTDRWSHHTPAVPPAPPDRLRASTIACARMASSSSRGQPQSEIAARGVRVGGEAAGIYPHPAKFLNLGLSAISV